MGASAERVVKINKEIKTNKLESVTTQESLRFARAGTEIEQTVW